MSTQAWPRPWPAVEACQLPNVGAGYVEMAAADEGRLSRVSFLTGLILCCLLTQNFLWKQPSTPRVRPCNCLRPINLLCCAESKRYAETLPRTPPHTCFVPTFKEGVRRNGEERHLQEGFAIDKRLKPLRGLEHHGVSEGDRIPLQQVCQLQKNRRTD